MLRAAAFVLLAACAADPPPPKAPVANQSQPKPQPDPQQEANDAVKAAREAEARIDQVACDLAALDKQLADIGDQIDSAHDDADHAAASARLAELLRQQV